MIFVTGGLFAGKRDFIRNALGLNEADFSACAIWDVERLAAQCDDLPALAQRLSQYEIVIANEMGCGVVPMDPNARHAREQAGRLACLLAAQADTVVRVCCGLGQVLKGTLC